VRGKHHGQEDASVEEHPDRRQEHRQGAPRHERVPEHVQHDHRVKANEAEQQECDQQVVAPQDCQPLDGVA